MTDLDRIDAAREAELNQALEALHFAFRAVVAGPDAELARHGLSRVHHRVLYFVGRSPGLSVNDLLGILGVTKQSLHRPLRELTGRALVRSDADPDDRRVRRLRLTAKGARLEARLSGDQRERFARAFADRGPRAEAGWRAVMGALAED